MGIRLRIPARSGTGLRRVAVLVTAVACATGLVVGVTQAAGAAPQPSITSVKAKINTLTGEFNKANQQYDQVQTQYEAAKGRLAQVTGQLNKDETRYQAARRLVVQIVDSSYEDSGSTSLAGLLTSSDPGTVLSEASILLQITGNRNLVSQAFLADANQLAAARQEQQRTEAGIKQLLAQRTTAKNSIGKLLDQQKQILGSLTATEVTAVEQGTVNSGGGTTSAVYAGPTGSQADTAVAFVFKQLGCPYAYGSTGPCSDGFDCSGLVMSAWAAAGISIPRDTYEQWAALPHVSSSDLQPGDLLFYNGIGHVAMYVGNGMIIDAPTQGEPVREIPMSTSWYADSFDGAARP